MTEKFKLDLSLNESDRGRDLKMDLYDCFHEPERFTAGGHAHQAAIKRAILAEDRLKLLETPTTGQINDLIVAVAFRDPRTGKHGTVFFHREIAFPEGMSLPDSNARLFGFIHETPAELFTAMTEEETKWLLCIRSRVWNHFRNRWQFIAVPFCQNIGNSPFETLPHIEEESVYKMFCTPWKRIREDVCPNKNCKTH